MTPHCRYHCAGCGSHFSSLGAFDAHRHGDPDDRHCLEPMDEDALALKTGEGVCAVCRETKEGVRIWQLARDADAPEDLWGAVFTPSEGESDRRAA